MDKAKVSDLNMAAIYEEESQVEKLSRKVKDSPFMVAGLMGLTGIVAYSLYGLRQRKLPLSLYLIHTRVAAQGFVVTCLTAGIAYSMFMDYVYPKIKGNGPSEANTVDTIKENH